MSLKRDIEHFDVIVIGSGVIGAATLRALAMRNVSVIVLEQFSIGHGQGSSHGASRAFTFAHPFPEFVEMAAKAHPLWRALERETSSGLLTAIGAVLRAADVSTITATLDRLDQSYEVLCGEDVDARFDIALPPDSNVIYQPEAGMLMADQALRALVDSAVSQGASVREQTPVTAIDPKNDSVVVHTAAGSFSADSLVVTAGGWAPRLLRDAGIEIPAIPTRETIAFYETDEQTLPALFEHGNPPVYSLISPGEGLKVGEHHAGPMLDVPVDGPPSQQSVARLTEYVRERFPSVARSPSAVQTCIYTNTPDERPIVERHGRIVVGSPCNGQGFKFAPLIGERLADLALESGS